MSGSTAALDEGTSLLTPALKSVVSSLRRCAISICPLTLSPPVPLLLYTLPYSPNLLFLIFDIRALWRSGLSARAPECQKLKIVGWTSWRSNPSYSGNLEQLALKGLTWLLAEDIFVCADGTRRLGNFFGYDGLFAHRGYHTSICWKVKTNARYIEILLPVSILTFSSSLNVILYRLPPTKSNRWFQLGLEFRLDRVYRFRRYCDC